MSGTIYGKNRKNINMTKENQNILTGMSNNKVIKEEEREKFMNVIRKVFLVNLQKDDLLRVFEGRNIANHSNLQRVVGEIQKELNQIKGSGGDVKSAIQKMIRSKNISVRSGEEPISKSILLLYAVLYDLVELVQEKLDEYEDLYEKADSRTKNDKERMNIIYQSLLYLARKYIRLREKIFQFFSNEK